ncbi:CD209 antigen-like protein E [Betta splendens]|uniref:CD209 antigen-like protein E n=1 Tax=Betta splendens TaxID=158456 RepID=A0A6P7LIB5_BETSP|nr:CD209 antigen-like protein E [Betta splendens]
MEETSISVEHEGFVHSRPTRNQTGLRSNTKCSGPVVLNLVLLSVLLLAGHIRQGFLYHDAAAELFTIKANVTDLTEERNQLKTNVTDLTEQRNQLKINITEMQKLLKQKKACPAGWRMFGCSCYLLSSRSGPWTVGRNDCIRRGAHLVVIKSREEQTFVSGITKKAAWIGLSDRGHEGSWTWIDGTPLTSNSAQFWWKDEPNNSGPTGDEDCVEITGYRARWNDMRCDASQRWICEKEA